ncbi:hypothetical protein ABZV61_37755 [Streptomyces sp900116325]|uniref:Uncharacterized protein n=1 Tax=Streptomyces sp. 900116325 TaxID=3154295 RepID=A0ABV2UKJ0_9ACTN
MAGNDLGSLLDSLLGGGGQGGGSGNAGNILGRCWARWAAARAPVAVAGAARTLLRA